MQRLHLFHHFSVNMQSSGGIHYEHIHKLGTSLFYRGTGNINWILINRAFKKTPAGYRWTARATALWLPDDRYHS